MGKLTIRYLEKGEYDIWDEFVDESLYGTIFSKSYWLQKVSSNF